MSTESDALWAIAEALGAKRPEPHRYRARGWAIRETGWGPFKKRYQTPLDPQTEEPIGPEEPYGTGRW